ncbi:IS5 family transposase [Nocardia lijiangensis]|uniref:IS5 family transposase n=1 Tax=Nocardia lijiangensis TaxID=299618 RepID=UPI000B04D0F4|nr:IS5 family transposase [Nocardia lijiangensis]
MPFYPATLFAGADIAENGCVCVACRFGHGRTRAARVRRYTSDTTDAQWEQLAAVLPWPVWLDGGGGRPEEYCRRQIIDAIFNLADNGCKWRNLPCDFPPWRTVYGLFHRWWHSGDVLAVHNDLRDRLRVNTSRDPDPTAAIIDSQTVRAAETVGTDTRGWDGGKKMNGRKRHIIVDTLGLLLICHVTAASVQDRDGARTALRQLRELFTTLALVWADGVYSGKLVGWARQQLGINLDIVRRSDKGPDSLSCRDVGSSNAPSPGSPNAADAFATTNAYPNTTKPWSPGR